MSQETGDILNLDPIWISGLITPVIGADGGVNHSMIDSNAGGLLIVLPVYQNMAENDWIDIYWGDSTSPVASDLVLAEHLGKDFQLYVAANRIPEGIHELHATITRTGGGNGGTSRPLTVLVRTLFPGGTDPEPGEPGHQNLPPPVPELPPGGIIDEEAAKNGVKVTVDFYLNMRRADVITLAWGGHNVVQTVTEEDMAAGKVEILVPESVIRAAGDGEVSLLYRVRDEVHNVSSDWSERLYVSVEIGEGLFDAPMIENPDHNADPYDVIDLDVLGDDDLLVDVMVYKNGFEIGDIVTLTWTGTTAQDLPVTVTPEPQTVSRDPQSLPFMIPNADLRVLGGGRGVAAYTVSRDGVELGASRRSLVSFRGAGLLLPPPFLPDAEDGVLDPALESTTLIIPGEALGANDNLFVTWHGTRANGSPLVHEFHRTISSGNAGRPVTFPVDGASLIAPLNGGSVAVYYRLEKAGSGIELRSERVEVSVGEARAELPAPTTRPAAVDGVLDPEQVTLDLEIAIQPWPDMRGGQRVFLLWQGSDGQNHTDDLEISDSTVGREVLFYLDRARLGEYMNQPIELSYRVESPGEATQYSDVARFSVGIARGNLPLPVIVEAEGSVVNPDDVLEGATVLIAAGAQFKDYDVVIVKVTSSVSGGSRDIRHEIQAGEGGKEVRVTVPWEVIDASAGRTCQVMYEITRAADGDVEKSGSVTYSVVSDIGDGPLLIMGARFNASAWRSWMTPRMLSALHRITLVPVLAEWRYEDQLQWTRATRWIDDKSWLKLYVRSASETWEVRAANIVGNGLNAGIEGNSAFVAMRDEVGSPTAPVVDLVAWGSSLYGGALDDRLSALDNVAEVTTNGFAFSARLRDGTVHNWGYPGKGDKPATILGDFVQVRGSGEALVGRKRDGGLVAWGWGSVLTIPSYVHQHKDYIDMIGAAHAMVALRKSGHAVAWGAELHGGKMLAGQDQFNDIIQLGGSNGALAALRDSAGKRSVIAWGNPPYGGDLPADIAGLTNISRIAAATIEAICVLLQTGAVRTWPHNSSNGGQLPQPIADLTNVLDVSATGFAFCAVLSNGQVAAWGHPDYGGRLSEEAEKLTNVVQVAGTYLAFAALCSDGRVVAWGQDTAGGNTTPVHHKLTNVRAIYANTNAFAALTEAGEVVTWGVGPGGGNSDAVQPELRGKVTHSRLLSSIESESASAATHGYGVRS